MAYSYPVILDVSDRLIVVVGGGAVASRKIVGLIEAGASRIRCVAPEFSADIPDSVERVAARYEPRHLDGAGLVFAATDSADVNAAVVRDARECGILVSRADTGDGPSGDFATPAMLRRDCVLVTVTSSSPALSARIRDGLAERWDERWSKMADLMQRLLPWLTRGGGVDQTTRAAILRELASEDALHVLHSGGENAVFHWLSERHPEMADVELPRDSERPGL